MRTTILVPVLAAATLLAPVGCSGSRPMRPVVPVSGNTVEILVTMHGFEPARVEVTHGRPVTMVVTRTTAMTCVTELRMPSHGIHMDLPLNEPRQVTFSCDSAGVMAYTCGMGMVRGEIVAR